MTINFKDKTAVITGGAKGIGASVAEQFSKAGARVIILDTDSKNFSIPREDKSIYFFACDISLDGIVKNTFEEIKKQFGKIDILVNNAGIQTYGTVSETSEEIWDRTFNVNVKGMYLCAKYAMQLLNESDAPVIINVSSVQALVCQKNVAAYASSKSAILGLTRSIAIDYAPKLRCVAVCPGAVMTPMLKADIETFEDKAAVIKETENIHLLQRIAAPEEIADFILFLSSEHAKFITGQYYRIDGGIGVKIEGT